MENVRGRAHLYTKSQSKQSVIAAEQPTVVIMERMGFLWTEDGGEDFAH